MLIPRNVHQFRDYPNRFYIGETGKGVFLKRRLYKYMNTGSFQKCLQSGTFLFSEPSVWKDHFEDRFYLADYSQLHVPAENTPKLYACCLSTIKECVASWREYAKIESGAIVNSCVKLTINRNKLLNALCSNPRFTIYEGAVNYVQDYFLLHLHEHNARFHQRWFPQDFQTNHFINLLLLKRVMFKFEDEFRYFIIDSEHIADEKGTDRLPVDVEWAELIEEVWLDYRANADEKDLVADLCRRHLPHVMYRQQDPNIMPDGGHIIIEE